LMQDQKEKMRVLDQELKEKNQKFLDKQKQEREETLKTLKSK
jgi:hypothetical protein